MNFWCHFELINNASQLNFLKLINYQLLKTICYVIKNQYNKIEKRN